MSRFITAFRVLLAGIALFLAAGSTASAQSNYDDAYGNAGSANYQQFYDDLSPYGDWINDPQYGYVWVPDAGDDFRPYYTNGYWVASDYGNTWVSSYDWGWAPFHYGRWTYTDYYGWLWIPGHEWGPAWVSWRSGGGCYGWAPLGPGISVNAAIGGYSCPDNWWTFTPQQYVLNQHFHQYSYGPRYAPQYVRQTTIINNTYVHNNNTYISGPRRRDMEQAIGQPIRTVSINNTRRPGGAELHGNSLNIYRPAIAEAGPRSSEHPHTFRQAEHPVSGVRSNPRETSITPDHSGFRNEAISREPNTIQQPVRNGASNGTFQRDPRLQRPQPATELPAQNTRVQNEQAAPRRDWGSKMPDHAPIQQATPPVQQQRVNREPFSRNNMEAPRQQPTRVERPMPAAQESRPQPIQRTEQPRFEQRPAPKQMPRQEAAPAPQRVERQPMSGGEGRQPGGR